MKNYGGVIWTNHALERLEQRNISQGAAFATFNRPDESRPGTKKGTFVYYKTWSYAGSNGGKRYEKIEVVARKDEGKWIILSVWSKPVSKPYPEKISLFEKIMKLLRL